MLVQGYCHADGFRGARELHRGLVQHRACRGLNAQRLGIAAAVDDYIVIGQDKHRAKSRLLNNLALIVGIVYL